MAGLVPGIHDWRAEKEDVDGRDKLGHDSFPRVLGPGAMKARTINRALLSVSDKTGLADFAQGLARLRGRRSSRPAAPPSSCATPGSK